MTSATTMGFLWIFPTGIASIAASFPCIHHDDLNVDLQTTHTAFSKINLVKWSRKIKNILHFTFVESWPSEFGESKGLWELPPHSGVMHITLAAGPAEPPCRIRSTVQWNQLDPRLSHHNLKKNGMKRDKVGCYYLISRVHNLYL